MNFKVFSLIILASVASAIAQNNQGGTLVTAPIRPFAVQDTFPTAWANEIKGGPFTSTNLTGLSNIPTSRLEIGSLGYAQDTGLFHRLTSTSPVTWSPINGSNFTTISATNISGTLAISNGGTGAIDQADARTNLGLPLAALTNTDNASFRTAIGLGATWLTNNVVSNFNNAIGLGSSSAVTFNSVIAGNAGARFASSSDGGVQIGYQGVPNRILIEGGGLVLNHSGFALSFGAANTIGAGQTRTNLGLGWSALTNTNTATSLLGFTTNGQVVANTTNTLTFTNAIAINGTAQINTIEPYGGGSGISIFDGIIIDTNGVGGEAFSWGSGVLAMGVPISFATTNIAATTRTNLGLGATWLTNSSPAQFQVDIFTTNRAIYTGTQLLYSPVATWASGTWVSSMPLDVLDPVGPGLPSYKAMTRSNLGLGATWLTNVAAPIFWTSVPSATNSTGSAGQVAYTNNYLYICISNNTWRRVQLGTW